VHFENAGVGRLDADNGEVLAVLFAQRVEEARVGADVGIGRRHGHDRRSDRVALRHLGAVDGLREDRDLVVDVLDQHAHRRAR